MATRLALIGAGGIGGYWNTALTGRTRGTLAYVVDVDLARAEAIARTHKGCVATTDMRVVLSDRSIDACIIATPHAFLAPLSQQALESGKHVLCEKPGALSVAELKKVQTIARRKKKVYAIGFNHRFHPAYLKAKELLESGEYGDVLFMRARYGFRGRPHYEKEWRFNKKISGGGELLDQGVHMIDIARWLLGDFRQVQGFVENRYWGGSVEDNAFLNLRTARGCVAQIHVSWTEHSWVHACEISCEKGFVSIHGLDQRYGGPETVTFGRNDRRKGVFDHPRSIVFAKEEKHDSFRRELDAFCSAIEGKRKDSSSADAMAVLSIVEKIYAQKR